MNYEDILNACPPTTEGLATPLKNFDYLFGLKLGHLLLRQSDNLSRTLQRKDISAAEGQGVAETTVEMLVSKRDNFDTFWQSIIAEASALNVDQSEEKRPRKTPARFKTGLAEDSPPNTVRDRYRKIYIELLDHIVGCIRARFQKEGFQT